MLTLLETPVVGPTAIIGLVIAIAVLIFLVLRTKVHALIALVVAASIAALLLTTETLVVDKRESDDDK